VKAKAAADGRQRLAAEKKTLEQAQGALDSALLEVPAAPLIAFIFLCLDRSFQQCRLLCVGLLCVDSALLEVPFCQNPSLLVCGSFTEFPGLNFVLGVCRQLQWQHSAGGYSLAMMSRP